MIDEIFGDIIDTKDYSKLCSQCILAPYNREVNEYNEEIILDRFAGELYVFRSIDEGEGLSGVPVLPELLNKLEISSLPRHELRLKVNCVTMLIRNINISEGLCNGVRLQMLDLGKYMLRAMILTGDKAGEIVFIPRVTLIEDSKFPYILKRHQFPLRVAFCMSINKSQGQTFEKIGIDLTRDVFGHGQLYVALSRTRNWSRIKVKIDDDNKDGLIKNVVWKEALGC